MAASSALVGETACAKPAIAPTNATTQTESHDISLERTIRFLPVEFCMAVARTAPMNDTRLSLTVSSDAQVVPEPMIMLSATDRV